MIVYLILFLTFYLILSFILCLIICTPFTTIPVKKIITQEQKVTNSSIKSDIVESININESNGNNDDKEEKDNTNPSKRKRKKPVKNNGTTSTSSSYKYDNQVKTLVEMGFNRKEAMLSLETTFGNVELSAIKLLEQAEDLLEENKDDDVT